MKFLLFSLAYSLLLMSCSKDRTAASPALTGNYQADATITPAAIEMYTQLGLVNNQAVVDNFIRRSRLPATYFSRTAEPVPAGYSLSLAIQRNNSATLVQIGPAQSETIEAEVTTQNGQYLVLTSRDSVPSVPVSASGGFASRCSKLADLMDLVLPKKRCVTSPLVTGYSGFCKYRPVWVVGITAGTLYIPQFSWLIQSVRTADGCTSAVAGSWNLLNPAVLNHLTTGDTLLVQQRFIRLLKK